MLAIRMQRTGRKGHAMFRMVVQDSRVTPTSGKVVALLGSYDPHAKTLTLDKDKAAFYLKNGAHPSERSARLLKTEGVSLPAWVRLNDKKQGVIRNAEKLRRNRPAEEPAPAEAATEATPATEETPALAEVEAETEAAQVEESTEAPAEAAAIERAAAADETEKPAE